MGVIRSSFGLEVVVVFGNCEKSIVVGAIAENLVVEMLMASLDKDKSEQWVYYPYGVRSTVRSTSFPWESCYSFVVEWKLMVLVGSE